jgi:hypothetical protein
MQIGTIVRIHPNFLEPNEDGAILYRVVSEPNANHRIDIKPAEWEYKIVPIESVHVCMVQEAI